jgi:hypothetical protein
MSGDPIRENQRRELRRLVRRFKAPCLLPRRKRTLWTQPYMVSPALVRHKFGNGKRLIWLTPIMHRPYYYLVWIDDRWGLTNFGDGEEFCNHTDEVWTAIAEEFGERERKSEAQYRWPEVDDDGGCAWGAANLDDVLPARARRRLERRAT